MRLHKGRIFVFRGGLWLNKAGRVRNELDFPSVFS